MPQRKHRGQPQWSRSPGKGSCLDHCGLGRLSRDSSQVSNEVSVSHAGGNDEHNNDVDVEMNTQINVGVIEAVGTGAPEAAGTSGGVLASDVGGGGGVVPSVDEAARGEVDEPAEDVIGSVVGGSTTKAIGGMEMAWNGPHRFLVPLCRLVQSHWVHSAYDINMAIYSSFAEVGFGSTAGTFIVSPTFPGTGRTESVTIELEEKWDPIWLQKSSNIVFLLSKPICISSSYIGTDIEHLQFIGMLSLEEVQTLYNREPIINGERALFFKNARGDEQQKEMEWHAIEQRILNTKRTKEWLDSIVEICSRVRTGKALKELIYNISKSKISFAKQSVCLDLLNTWLRNNEKHCKIRMEKVMKEKAYISQSIATGEEMLQVWDEKFLSSPYTDITLKEYICACFAELGNGWLPHGGMSSAEFKNQPEQPFLARRMVYKIGVLQKLLTRGKKLGMYELEFYCPCTHERKLCLWYLELVEQMLTSDFGLDLYLECHPGLHLSHTVFQSKRLILMIWIIIWTEVNSTYLFMLNTKRLVHVEPIIYMSLWNTLNT
ncbi:hypothetical protein SELMODRAFT_416888 [Selaginella moellendorffii]|uniref:Uncharacterized protein n=1 Tax=Selaginella moellendorffii TaxID=88036 RepID=D8S0Q3_SELML|nr:hypothetical protein SELMODRAFT_416888 [Selaginella moellendorffii]